MSVWYSIKIVVYGDSANIAKLLNIDPNSIGVDSVQLSFGNKNSSGINIQDLARKNPDLIFLYQITIECCSGSVWLIRYNKYLQKYQEVCLEQSSFCETDEIRDFNKKIIEDYPNLVSEYRKNKYINWESFCYKYSEMNTILDQYQQYEDLSTIMENNDFDFDNDHEHCNFCDYIEMMEMNNQ